MRKKKWLLGISRPSFAMGLATRFFFSLADQYIEGEKGGNEMGR